MQSAVTARAPWRSRRPYYYLFLADVGMLILGGLAVHRLHVGSAFFAWASWEYQGGVALAALGFGSYGFYTGLYDWRRFHAQLRNVWVLAGGVIMTFGLLVLLAFALKIGHQVSRIWLFSWLALFAVYLLASRTLLLGLLDRLPARLLAPRRALILGSGPNGQAVLDFLRRFEARGIAVVGFIDDRAPAPGRAAADYRGVRHLGPVDRLSALIREQRIEMVIVALPWRAHERIASLVRRLSSCPLDVYVAPDRLGLRYADRPIHRIGGMHLLSLQDCPIDDWQALVKRAEDLAIAIPALVLLAPLLVLVAAAIKLESPGPVLFVQERYGFNDEIIRVYKFRSMAVRLADDSGARRTTRDDPRVTRVGRFIRRTSIDELPQLFNVVRGEMSIVGPRPHALGMHAEGRRLHEALDRYASRHRVKPGITGWAQCNGWRGEADTREKLERRVEHDLYYIENWSIFLDLLIVFRTLRLLLRADANAY